jgi:hypothetical protein
MLHGGHDLGSVGAFGGAFERFVDERRGRQLRGSRRIDDRVHREVGRLVEARDQSRISLRRGGSRDEGECRHDAQGRLHFSSGTTIAEFGTP